MHNNLANKRIKDLLELRPLFDKEENEGLEDNLIFLKGNHFNGGKFWVGPKLNTGTPLDDRFINGVLECFVSSNAIKDVTERESNAILGKDPSWRIVHKKPQTVPTEEELLVLTPEEIEEINVQIANQEAIGNEANNILKTWFAKRHVKEKLQELHKLARNTSKARIRIFIPEGRLNLNKSGQWELKKKDLAEAILDIFIEVPDFENSFVYTDRRTMLQMGVYFFTEDNILFAEVVYLDDNKNTIIKILSDKGILNKGDTPENEIDEAGNQILKEVVAETSPLPLGENLTIAELRVPLLVTEQIRSLQKQLNKTLTMVGHVSDVAGFPEDVVTNGQMPTKEIPDPKNPSKTITVPDKSGIKRGAAYRHYINGFPTGKDQAGNINVTTPSYQRLMPAPIDGFERTIKILWERILFEAKQIFVLISGEATPSGESRKQALWDFLQSILVVIGRIEEIGTWLLETVLQFACIIAGEADKFKDYRVEFICALDLGPISADEKKFILNALAAGVFTLDRARKMLGVEDTQAEQQQWIKEQKEKREMNTSIGQNIVESFTDGDGE